jgi:hypothetical protein
LPGGPAQAAGLPPAPPARVSGPAVASLVLGILGFCTLGLTALPGLVLGIWGLGATRRREGGRRGRGMAVAGTILSVVGLGYLLLVGAVALWVACEGPGDRSYNWTFDLGEGRAVGGPQALAGRMLMASHLADAARECADEHDGRLPRADAMPTALERYLRRGGEVLRLGTARCPFAMNAGVGGLAPEDLARPDRTVLFFEVKPGGPTVGGREALRPPAGGDDTYVFVFADGRVRTLSGDDLADLVWQPAAAGLIAL